MAILLQPEQVLRLDPADPWNKISGYGWKYHLFKRDPKDGIPHKTACLLVLEQRQFEVAPFVEVKAKDLCSYCFRGQLVVD